MTHDGKYEVTKKLFLDAKSQTSIRLVLILVKFLIEHLFWVGSVTLWPKLRFDIVEEVSYVKGRKILITLALQHTEIIFTNSLRGMTQ